LTGGQESERPIPVEVHEPAPGPFAIAQTIAGTAFSPLETIFIVIVFVVFILLQREDLRNRFIRLAGSRDLQRTTMAMNDAAGRLSRFFLVQTLVNACFGIIIAVGLYFIAAGFPIALAAAIDPGWGIALETLALFLMLNSLSARRSSLGLRPPNGDFADCRRRVSDILDLVVGAGRPCLVDSVNRLFGRAWAARGTVGFSRCHFRGRAAAHGSRNPLSTNACRRCFGGCRPSRGIFKNLL
jgi:hypothetical protein